jgi:hypothetical protein
MSSSKATRLLAATAAIALAACGGSSQKSGSVLVTASGEALALGGYGFPPATADDVAFVDGWEVAFTKVIVVFDHVRLSQNPDLSPTDQSRTGPVVAQVNGPWMVDLHKGGPLPGAGGAGEQAVAITTITGNFDPTQRYAFSFDTVAATPSATNVNVDAADFTDMVSNGYTSLFVGTATWRGDAPGVTCTNTNGAYDFAALPTVVNFRFGFTAPASYINAQNPKNDPATPFAGEEHQRGINIPEGATTTAQATFHTDHLFWDSFLHDSPLHFDHIAARHAGEVNPTATLADLVGLDFTAFTDKNGVALPWRACVDTFTPGTGAQMHFDNLSVPFALNGPDPGVALRDYRDFMTYGLSTFGHLNADGLTFVQRSYPSPL